MVESLQKLEVQVRRISFKFAMSSPTELEGAVARASDTATSLAVPFSGLYGVKDDA